MSEFAVRVRNVSKSFRSRILFREASLDVPKGEVVGIQGPNGSGKSVLFKMICGFTKPQAGDIWVAPDFYENGSEFPVHAGIIIDRAGYLPGLSGRDNLLDLARIRRVASPEAIDEAMVRVGLEPGLPTKVRSYSLGMKQKLAIAQSLMEGQSLLLWDEAFNGLDRSSVERTRELIGELVAEGRTIILTSHNQNDIDSVCTQVFEIEEHHFERLR